MHVNKALLVVVFTLPPLLAAPIPGGLRGLMGATPHAVQNPAFALTSQPHTTSAARVKLPTYLKLPTPPLVAFGAAQTKYIRIPKRGSTTCRASAEPPDTASTVLEFHPDGPNGLDELTTKKATIGKLIGIGTTGIVFDVPRHDFGAHALVAKRFSHHGSVQPTVPITKEIANLRALGQFHGAVTRDGYTWVLMDKIRGRHLGDTAVYKAAQRSGPAAVDGVMAMAAQLVSNARLDCADKYGLVHKDLHHKNIRYEEHDGKLSGVHLLDWGDAKVAPQKGPDGKFTRAQRKVIRHLTKSISPNSPNGLAWKMLEDRQRRRFLNSRLSRDGSK